MAKMSLSTYLRDAASRTGELQVAGPFVTISRQYGCYGFSLGMLIMEILNDHALPGFHWRVYNKDILARLARETHLAQDLLARQRRSEPRYLVEFFRSLSPERIPSGMEIQERVASIVRSLSIQGRAIIIGQGGAAATRDLPNGLSVRLEAPEAWRLEQVMYRSGVSRDAAIEELRRWDDARAYLRGMYEKHFPHRPSFHITYDCSAFSPSQIAQHVVQAMRFRGLI
jgi:hypothetical protein